MPGPLKNAKYERFAQLIIQGRSVSDAYVDAGYRRHPKNCCRLRARPDVAARIAELQERVADKVTTTAADIARQLDEDREFARSRKNPSAAVSATMGKAKVLGLIVERHAGPTGGAIPIRFDLSGLSDEELDQLEHIRSRISIDGGNQGGEGQAGGEG